MSTLGIIVEYNPFHNGHLYHLNEAKRITNATTTIAVMSGSFLQRGEPAIVDKWTRTKMALNQGVDLVIELPFIYSTQSADWFAFGSTFLLHHLGVENFVFGSENNSIDKLHKIADVLQNEPANFKNYLKKELSLGHSYPKAISLSLEKYFNNEDFAISTPNDILGIQYLTNLKKLNSNIKPYTIKRLHANYHDQTITSKDIASATAIRKEIFTTNSLASIKSVVPSSTYELLNQEWQANRINNWGNFLNTLLIIANSKSHFQMENIHGIEEGLEKRIKDNLTINTFEDLVKNIKTKRYTVTKIQRSLLYVLLDITKEKIDNLNVAAGPSYIRVLGFNENGRSYLNKIKKSLQLPIITNISKNKIPMLELDLIASNIYELGFKQPVYNREEFKQAPIYFA